MSETVNKQIDRLKKMEKKVEQFGDLLDSIESTEDKKKMLWKEIYENAVTDRENAGLLFTDAYNNMAGGSTEHATLGPILAKYLERMNKSNEQILRLAELVAKAEERAAQLDPDDIFAQIGSGKE